MLSTHKKNIIVGTVFLAFVAICFMASLSISNPSTSSDPGPAAYPQFVLVLLALCAVGVILTPDDKTPDSQPRDWRYVVAVFGTILGYVILLSTVGYILATLLFVSTMLLLAGERRVPVIAIYSVVLPLALFYVFSEYLSIALPSGLIEGFIQ